MEPGSAAYRLFMADLQGILFGCGDASESDPETLAALAAVVTQYVTSLYKLSAVEAVETVNAFNAQPNATKQYHPLEALDSRRVVQALARHAPGSLAEARARHVVAAAADLRASAQVDVGVRVPATPLVPSTSLELMSRERSLVESAILLGRVQRTHVQPLSAAAVAAAAAAAAAAQAAAQAALATAGAAGGGAGAAPPAVASGAAPTTAAAVPAAAAVAGPARPLGLQLHLGSHAAGAPPRQ